MASPRRARDDTCHTITSDVSCLVFLTTCATCAPRAAPPLLPPAGGMVEFRRSLAASFLFKGLVFAAQQLEAEVPSFHLPFPDAYRSGACAHQGGHPQIRERLTT